MELTKVIEVQNEVGMSNEEVYEHLLHMDKKLAEEFYKEYCDVQLSEK